MRQVFAIAALVLALTGAEPGLAQQSQTLPLGQPEFGQLRSPILVVDIDRMFRESAIGLRVTQQRDDQVAALEAENIKVKEALEAEEKSLTDLRETTEAAAFRDLAEAFDEKVQEAERQQVAKQQEILAFFRGEENAFLKAANGVLERLLLESGAIVILDRQLVRASITQVDITDRAIALLDETIGSGVEGD